MIYTNRKERILAAVLIFASFIAAAYAAPIEQVFSTISPNSPSAQQVTVNNFPQNEIRTVANLTGPVPPSFGVFRSLGTGIDVTQFAKVTILYRLRFVGDHTGDLTPEATAHGGFTGLVPFTLLFELGAPDFRAIPGIIGLASKTISVDYPVLNVNGALTCATVEGCTGTFRLEILLFLQRS